MVDEAQPVPAWCEYAIASGSQLFAPIAGSITRYNVTQLQKVASSSTGSDVLVLDDVTGEVLVKRAGRFIICGATYVQGSIEGANPGFTISVMGAIVVRIPEDANVGIRTHEVRLGQNVVVLSSDGYLQDSGFSVSGCTALMLPAGTKINLRVGVIADNLSKGTFLNWQTRGDAAVSGAHLSIHEL